MTVMVAEPAARTARPARGCGCPKLLLFGGCDANNDDAIVATLFMGLSSSSLKSVASFMMSCCCD